MRRGSTPTNIIETDISLVEAVEIYATYEQGHVKMEKTRADMTVYDTELHIRLTQEETLLFEQGHKDCSGKWTKPPQGEVQLRAVFADGSAPVSNIMTFTVLPILKEGVI